MSYQLGTEEFNATLEGTWNPGTVPPFDELGLPDVQNAASRGVRDALYITSDQVQFHVVARDSYPGGTVARALWRVEMYVGGPMLIPNMSTPHRSGVIMRLTLHPHLERRQVTYAEDETVMPYPGILSNVIPALLLRGFWGLRPRDITVGEFGTGTFTPEQVRYRRMGQSQDSVAPIDAAEIPADFRFVRPADDPRRTGLWVVASDPARVSAKASYCVAGFDEDEVDRWDEPEESVPEFVPLDWEV